MKLTANERIVLNMIALNTYQPSNGSRPDEFKETSSIWSTFLTDTSAEVTISGRTLSSVCSSLAQKGLIDTHDVKKRGRGMTHDESTIWLTERGFREWMAAYPPPARTDKKSKNGHREEFTCDVCGATTNNPPNSRGRVLCPEHER